MSFDVTIPQIGESVKTVFISQWFAKIGDTVEAGDPVLELDSDKASMEVPAPAAGVIVETLVEEGDEVPVGTVVCRIEAAPAGAATAAEAPAAPATGQAEAAVEVKAGPAARTLASEKGVDLGSVSGTGKGGRVTSDDVQKALAPPPPVAAEAAPAAAPVAAKPAPAEAPAGRVTRKKMSPLRRTIARRLVEAQQTAAMLTTFNEVDMTEIMGIRSRYQEEFKAKHGIKLGFMSFFIKAAIEGLKQFPAVNAEIDGNEILYKHYYNIGVAVSGPKGLVVPVVRDADRLSFAGVEQEIAALGARARDNKLGLADFKDGTFTISNGGVFGSMMSTPILNPPQVAILGMHNIIQRPVGVDGRIELRPMMYLALSYDHRIIDGREAVSFLVKLKKCVEQPERILFEV